MARATMMCLLLLTSSLQHVTSFAVHRRQSRSTDLADALRMLERQRRRIDNEENLLVSAPQMAGDRPLSMADLELWFEAAPAVPPSRSEDDIRAAWMAKTLGLDGYGGVEDMQDVRQTGEFLPDIPIQEAPMEEEEPSDQELDAIFGEKSESDETASRQAPPVAQKREKEVMTDVKSDVKPNKVNTRSSEGVIVAEAASEGGDDVKLTKDEFNALLKAVEKLQKQAVDRAEVDAEEAQEVAQEVEEKVEEAREEAKAIEEAAQEEEAQEEAVEEEADRVLTPQPVSNEELDNLFQEQSEEVIPTLNGEIIRKENTVRDEQGVPVGREQSIEDVEHVPSKGGLSPSEDFWYLKNYLEQDGDRKKRNSKRYNFAPGLSAELSPQSLITPPDSAELIGAYISKINQLQSELDQAKLVSYLEDVENDILTDALNQATLAQVKGRINPEELSSLQDAIRVEEALQQVKTNRAQAAELADEFADEIDAEMGTSMAEKRAEPWRKRDDVMQSEVPVFVTGDNDDVIEDNDDDSEEAATALALGQLFEKSPRRIDLDDIFDTSQKEAGLLVDRPDDDLIRGSDTSALASLFSRDAAECPAVREFSTNCDFAGSTVDYEARALCNVHEMCYVCGHTLQVEQGQCDFIYRAAATMLCEEDEECVLEAEIFLNTMKLKHRFVPYSQPICKTRCAAQFLSLI